MSEPVELLTVPVQYDSDDPLGYNAGYVRLGPLLAATLLGATVYELARGQSVCPYHYEYGNEEWLLVLAGRPTLRDPDGEHELEPWDVVVFREGPEGAHKVTNRGDETARIAMLSTKRTPDVSVYPDSGKIGVFPGNPDDQLLVRRSDGVDYWEGEV